jgi:hypothetical protein
VQLDSTIFDPQPGQPIDPEQLDPERLRGLIELGLVGHPEHARLDRLLRAGAEFTVNPRPGDSVEITLAYSRERSPALAALRARGSGGEVGLLDAQEYDENVLVTVAPLSALKRVNVG